MVVAFAIVGGILAFIPGVSILLIFGELTMLYLIMHRSPKFNMITFLGLGTALASLSALLKVLASFLHVLPLVGQFANSLVAFAFILAVGKMAERHFGPT